MTSDQEIIHEFIDRKSSDKLMAELHSKLLDRAKLSRGTSFMSSCSTIKSLSDGYIDKLGVSDKDDLFTDFFGKFMASALANNGTAACKFFAKNSLNVNRETQAHGYGGNNGQFGLFGGILPPTNGTVVAQLGIGLTLVTRQDIGIQTPIVGTGSGTKALDNNVSSYAPNAVSNSMTTLGLSVANTVSEGALFIVGHIAASNISESWCYERFNYTPTLFGIGEVINMENTIQI
jgi:hypothetical protein